MTRTVLFNGVPTKMAVDDPLPEGSYAWAVALARFVDEGTGAPILAGVRVETDFPRLKARASGSVGGVYGFPPEAFPFLASQGYDLSMRVETDAHLSQAVPIRVPQRADAFESFAPVALGDVVLHRRGAVLTGRCLRKTTGAPVVGATVAVTKAWCVLPTPAVATPEETATLVSVWPPLPYILDDATASVRRRNLTPSDPRPLSRPASKGDAKLVVADASGLATNGVLRIDGNVPDRLEYAVVDSMNGNAVTLKRPLILDHRLGAVVERTSPGGLGAAKAVVHGALPGDVALYLSDAAGLSYGDQVRVQAPGEADGYHLVRLYETITDARGTFALPPLSRAGQVEVTATAPGLNVIIKKIPLSSDDQQICGDFLL